MSLRLSQKYGVNPSVRVCFFCGEDDGSLILAGSALGGKQAPHRAVWSREPCKACKDLMQQGILLMSVRAGEKPSGNPYRTGGWCVVTEDGFKRMFSGPEAQKALEARWAFLDDTAWDAAGLPRVDVPKQESAS